MVRRESSFWKENKDYFALGYLCLWVFIGLIFIPLLGLFPGEGAEKQVNLTLVYFYWGAGGISLIVIVIFKIISILRNQNMGDVRARKFGGLFNPLIWDFEEGFLYDLSQVRGLGFFKNTGKFFNQFIFGVLFFSFWGLAGTISEKVRNTFFFGIPNVINQVSQPAEISFGVYPASTSESLIDLVVISLTYGFLKNELLIKRNMPKFIFWMICIPITIFITVLWRVAIHSFAYKGDDLSLLSVSIFSAEIVFYTLATGGILLAFLKHDLHNLFIILQRTYPGSDILLYSIIIIGSLITLLIGIRIIKKEAKIEEVPFNEV